MNIIFLGRVSSTLGLAALGVICGGLSAQAETTNAVVADPVVAPLVSQNKESFTTQADPALASTLAEVARSAAKESSLTAASESATQVLDPQLALEPSDVLSQGGNITVADSTSEQSELTAETSDNTAETALTPKATNQGSAADLAVSSTSQPLETTAKTAASAVAQTFPGDDTPGAVTRSSPSYIGVGGSVGFIGDSALGDNGLSFSALSKIRLTSNVSIRPAAVIDFDGDSTILLPATFDFATQTPAGPFNISPYLGGGAAINVGDNSDVGPLLTGGIDVPLTSQFTGTVGLNLAVLDDVDLGLFFGIGYNFRL